MNNNFVQQAIIIASSALLLTFFIFFPYYRTAHSSSTDQNLFPEQKPLSILFDLNGVLFRISKKRALSHLGFLDMLSYVASGNKPNQLKNKVFTLLHRLRGHDALTYLPQETDTLTPMHDGVALPEIMCDWMRGIVPGHEIMKAMNELIETLDQQQFFTSEREKRLIKRINVMMFDPAVRLQLYVPIRNGIRLLKLCKKRGNKVYLLSNMDSELIKLLEKKYPDSFGLFDGTIVSADVKMIKPDNGIYLHAIKAHNIDPATCWLVDDQIENILGAEQAGIQALQFSAKTALSVRQTLMAKGMQMGVKPKKKVKKAA